MPSARALVVRGDSSLQFGRFALKSTGLVVSGHPSFDEWSQVGEVLHRIEGAVQFWIGDWINYGETHYGEKYSTAREATDFDRQTLENYAYVARHVEIYLRKENVSFSIHQQVAPLSVPRQRAILERAAEEGLTVREVKDLIRGDAHTAKIAAIAAGELPAGEFDVVCADPPWSYDNAGFDQSAAEHYPTMTVEAIAALPTIHPTFPKFANPCVLFLWATSPLLPDAHIVMDTWGFDYKACIVWVKDRAPGLGWWLHTRHELLLIGARGASTPLERVDSVISAAVNDHSRKPDEAYAVIDRMYPPGLRRVECFARAERPNWTVWGNEV